MSIAIAAAGNVRSTTWTGSISGAEQTPLHKFASGSSTHRQTHPGAAAAARIAQPIAIAAAGSTGTSAHIHCARVHRRGGTIPSFAPANASTFEPSFSSRFWLVLLAGAAGVTAGETVSSSLPVLRVLALAVLPLALAVGVAALCLRVSTMV